MFSRSHIVSLAAAIVLAGSVWAQPQGPPGASGQTPPTGSTSGVPRNTPGDPGVAPPDQQMDPYTVDKGFVRDVADSGATAVQLATLAPEKASRDAVKEIGKQIEDAHALTRQQLRQAASASNIQASARPL